MSRSSLRKLILVGAIAALSAWLAIDTFLPAAGPAQARAATPDVARIPEIVGELLPEAASTIPEAELAERRLLAAAPWPADPFFRTATTRKHGGETRHEQAPASGANRPYVLSATVSGERPLAMINGTVLSVGDRLGDGSTITAIDNYAVTLQGPQGPWVLELSE
jgi:hypothetical protein